MEGVKAVPDATLLRLIENQKRATAELEDYLLGSLPDDMVPLKEAQYLWNCEYKTALMRAVRGAGTKKRGRWFIPRSAI